MSIPTAKSAPKDIASELMKACEIGEQCYAIFKNEILEEEPPAKKFQYPLKTNKLKTFSDMCKRKLMSSGRAVILKANRSLFGCIIVMAQRRSIRMEDILCQPLGPLPWTLPTSEGLLRKTNKAALATTLQNGRKKKTHEILTKKKNNIKCNYSNAQTLLQHDD